MALDSSGEQPQEPPRVTDGINKPSAGELKLQRFPNPEHKPENYEKLPVDFPPSLFSSLEHYLPEELLNSTVEAKACFINEILLKYSPEPERTRIRRHRAYRDKILSSYKRLHEEIYSLDNLSFFAPSFLEAVSGKSEQSLRSVMVELYPGIFTFQMLNPQFCKLLLEEVEHMEKWVSDSRSEIMRPNTMNKFGLVLDDFGFESMLQKLVDDFINPISQVLFPDVCGSSLDSHHGFIVEYGEDRDTYLDFHVDDAEVCLNVCLGKQFSGGELYFRGVRCEKHVNSPRLEEEDYDYSHVPGQAVLHLGRHRHGARATIAGHRANLILWCRSSSFREMTNYFKDFSSWCGECKSEKQTRMRMSRDAAREAIVGRTV